MGKPVSSAAAIDQSNHLLHSIDNSSSRGHAENVETMFLLATVKLQDLCHTHLALAGMCFYFLFFVIIFICCRLDIL